MKIQLLKLKKGSSIQTEKGCYQITKNTSLRVIANNQTDKARTASPVAGSHQPDPAQPVDKSTILGLLQEHMERLEQSEYQLMMDGIYKDDELEPLGQSFGELHQPSLYGAVLCQLSELKSLFKKIENL